MFGTPSSFCFTQAAPPPSNVLRVMVSTTSLRQVVINHPFFRHLVPDVWNSIFHLLTLTELFVVSCCCKWMHVQLLRYCSIMFNKSKLLHFFLALEDIDSFRSLLRVAGGIMCGSAVLHFLDRPFRSDNDTSSPTTTVFINPPTVLACFQYTEHHVRNRVAQAGNANLRPPEKSPKSAICVPFNQD